jgi:hypothetical protein
MPLHIGEQKLESAAMMMMGHDSSRDTEDAIQYGWPPDHRQAYTPDTNDPSTRLRKLRTSREPAGVWVLRLAAITMATRPRCFDRATAARTCAASHISRASRSDPAFEPAIAPVDQAKAIDPAIISRRFAAFVAHVVPCDTTGA